MEIKINSFASGGAGGTIETAKEARKGTPVAQIQPNAIPRETHNLDLERAAKTYSAPPVSRVSAAPATVQEIGVFREGGPSRVFPNRSGSALAGGWPEVAGG